MNSAEQRHATDRGERATMALSTKNGATGDDRLVRQARSPDDGIPLSSPSGGYVHSSSRIHPNFSNRPRKVFHSSENPVPPGLGSQMCRIEEACLWNGLALNPRGHFIKDRGSFRHSGTARWPVSHKMLWAKVLRFRRMRPVSAGVGGCRVATFSCVTRYGKWGAFDILCTDSMSPAPLFLQGASRSANRWPVQSPTTPASCRSNGGSL